MHSQYIRESFQRFSVLFLTLAKKSLHEIERRFTGLVRPFPQRQSEVHSCFLEITQNLVTVCPAEQKVQLFFLIRGGTEQDLDFLQRVLSELGVIEFDRSLDGWVVHRT